MLRMCFVAMLILASCGVDKPMSDFNEAFGNLTASDLSSTQLVGPSTTLGSRGDWVKFLRVETDDGQAVSVNINLRGEYSLPNPLVSPDGHTVTGVAPVATPAIGFPLVARIRWGVGGSYQTVDIDIPPSRSFNVVSAKNSATDDIGDGVSICLTGSAFEVQVRNDGNLSLATTPGASAIASGNLSLAKVLAFITPGTGANVGPIRRTIYLASTNNGSTLAAGNSVSFVIPSFARQAWFFRLPLGGGDPNPLQIQGLNTMGNVIRQTGLGAGVEGPVIIMPDEQVWTVVNIGGVPIFNMEAMFDVNPS